MPALGTVKLKQISLKLTERLHMVSTQTPGAPAWLSKLSTEQCSSFYHYVPLFIFATRTSHLAAEISCRLINRVFSKQIPMTVRSRCRETTA